MTCVLNRRRFLQGTSAGATALAAGGLPFRAALAAENLTIGIVYVGAKDDFGWNQAHAVGVKALRELPDVKVVEEENVPETDAVSKTMESMINLDGAKLILPTSFGYWSPFVLDEAKANPGVQFRHAAPLRKQGDPKNSGSYFAFLDQAHYVDGVAAGLASKTGKLGFVAAKPIGIVLRNINSFLTGARTTNPQATVHVIFTGDWALPVREAEATNALVDAGCDLITCHVDGPKVVIQTAESRGVKSGCARCRAGPGRPGAARSRVRRPARSGAAAPARGAAGQGRGIVRRHAARLPAHHAGRFRHLAHPSCAGLHGRRAGGSRGPCGALCFGGRRAPGTGRRRPRGDDRRSRPIGGRG